MLKFIGFIPNNPHIVSRYSPTEVPVHMQPSTGNHDWWTDALVERAYTGSQANKDAGVLGWLLLPDVVMWLRVGSVGFLVVDLRIVSTKMTQGSMRHF